MLEKLFAYFIRKRNSKFDTGEILPVKCKTPVISVGNLSVGGTGKTPLVIYISNKLSELGNKVAVIGRGYKRKSKGEIVVSDGKNILADVSEAGDEMLLIAEKTCCPVLVHSKKYEAGLSAEKLFNVDYILLDDGFQHRKLSRKCDIVLIDRVSLENPFLLPKGRLRESFDALARADIICLTKGAKIQDLIRKLPKNTKPNLKIFEVNFVQASAYSLFNKNNASPADKKYIAIAGLANPKNFFEMLTNNNYCIIEKINFSDHHNYTKSDILKIINSAKRNNTACIATTEKDAVKLKKYKAEFINNNIDIFVFPLEVIIKGDFISAIKECVSS
ncbi:MAG: tetraacyldisaccharide 4'-kinase [Ignavibacteria bacterium]|jgi:tetraacyldisaccharide 4'-kinase|nr:tetraacyldisaccharide 4'-kinase [Ignavibacteria bacterium]